MTEEQEKKELLDLGEKLNKIDTDKYAQAREKWISEGYIALRKVFPYLKRITGEYCEVFGYKFVISYMEDKDNKKIFYLIRIGTGQAGVFPLAITRIITKEDMARMLNEWEINERHYKEWVESQKANKSKNRGFFRDFFNL